MHWPTDVLGGSGITITPFYDLVSVVFEASGNQHIDTSLAMAIGNNFDIDAITAFDLLSFADESNIPFPLLKRRVVLIARIVLDKVSTLQFDEFEFNKNQTETIDELKQFVIQRANELLDQSNQMDIHDYVLTSY